MKLNLRIIAIIITCGCSSCICPHEARTTIIDYDRLLFSNGEYTTLLSKYVIHDTLSTDSVDIGYSVLNGMCFAREPLYELYGQVNRERISYLDCLFDWPHLIIPSLNLDIEITEGSCCVIIPSGTYDVIVISRDYYPIHFKRDFVSQHIYSIDFYLGGTSIH